MDGAHGLPGRMRLDLCPDKASLTGYAHMRLRKSTSADIPYEWDASVRA